MRFMLDAMLEKGPSGPFYLYHLDGFFAFVKDLGATQASGFFLC